ncbi:putative dual specificity protein phosphatase DSP8 [Vigna radiata var. radiata]|uniref:phosphatidylglycerophosphatase n=1 Tax=Vigna radiata var. radiata TaxID=3916 RepID=A0A1S3UJ66_VIGRR|nr:putative dual specificity protein phosphatase DSP8 [Vigna radiata var. radiata]
MHIEELKGGDTEEGEGERGLTLLGYDAKRALVGAGARVLFYPTLFYNVVRNKIEADFRWWDKVDEFILLGAVPFPIDVPHLKELGVRGVITLNESYETLVPTTLYYTHGINHLVIPTRDYYFAPSLHDIRRAVNFIHENALSGRTTYVHCKAGRGRSTTIVICYLVHHKMMTPDAAYNYVKSIRPRVLLASSQWQVVQEYYHHIMVRRAVGCAPSTNLLVKASEGALDSQDVVIFDDSSFVMVTGSDLEGYNPSNQSRTVASEIWADLSVVYRVRVAGQAAFERISCLWLRYGTNHNTFTAKPSNRHLGEINVDIRMY